MAVFPVYRHNAPLFSFTDVGYQFVNRVKAFLNINPCKANLVKILYLVVWFHHELKYTPLVVKPKSNMRQRDKSSPAGFHPAVGGAVPTLAHHNLHGDNING